ncbi:MAG TPA: O-antigen ligase family protein [Pyrinomonadaceae bacterium]|nr:O-antigen ligase family protein [Chloracidobacterium sp.]MBP9934494.1 O-antigen ligase family protein [Pyrinomonadaceae bacterium]MBK9437375.1 O-antigen ligase family protein [Chloracidobacterium sp.]MBL0240048.1 O-antigen ligase family protein [Chloracidobacterium sp.]HQX56594.1 O-antigen ligase family protein [Pyrinomonadaceae bacterium]
MTSQPYRTPVAFSALLSVILVAVLFRLPRPTIQVNLPYKVELLLAIFTICLLVYWRLTGVTREQIFRPVSGNLRLIMLTICGFIVWSGMSAFWSSSIDAAIQHTLLWSLYLVLFVLFTAIIRLENGVRTLVSTFGFAAIILGTLCLFEYVLLTDFASNEGNLRIRYGKYAEMLVTLLPILWAAAAYSRRRGQRLWLLLAAVLGWETAMLSLSKGAFIAGIAGTALFFIGGIFFSSTAFRKRILVLAGVWVAITIGTQVLFSAFTAMPSTTDYITGAADSTRSTSDMRIYTWSVGRQMASDSWLLGVGADNFGLVFNDARAKLRDLQPDEPKSEIGEDFLTERAHNEPLQVLAELGVIGFTLFVLPFLLFLVFVLRKFGRDGWKLSPMLWATLGSNLAFAISSMVSSFSFRAAQNGVVFFIVFAIAMNELRRPARSATNAINSVPAYLLSWGAVTLLAAFCLIKGYAEYQVYQAEWTESPSVAQDRYRAALAVDSGYSGAYLSSAARYVSNGDQASAAVQTRQAINSGIGLSLTYSQLAKQQIAAGDHIAARVTYQESLTIYPRSIFLRIEYTVFLEKLGDAVESARQLAVAREIDRPQANGWYKLITAGSLAAFYEAQTNKDLAEPNALIPAGAVFQYIDKPPAN